MRRIIYLFNNLHINKISISFIIISTLLLVISVDASIDIDLNNLEDLRNYSKIKSIFINDISNMFEIVISIFVIVLSFMELYNNSHLFDVVLIAYHKKTKVITCKLISYIMIIVLYVTLIFSTTTVVAVIKFKDVYLLNDLLIIYFYCLMVSLLILLTSILLLTLFKNYFASFILLIFVVLKRIFLETNNKIIINILPYLIQDPLSISITPTFILLQLIILLTLNYIVFKFKDIKT